MLLITLGLITFLGGVQLLDMTVGTQIVQWMIVVALGYFDYRLIKESDRLTHLIHLYELSVVFIGLLLYSTRNKK